jgi:hypothetical protein
VSSFNKEYSSEVGELMNIGVFHKIVHIGKDGRIKAKGWISKGNSASAAPLYILAFRSAPFICLFLSAISKII